MTYREYKIGNYLLRRLSVNRNIWLILLNDEWCRLFKRNKVFERDTPVGLLRLNIEIVGREEWAEIEIITKTTESVPLT